MQRITRLVLRRKRLVVTAWAVLTLVGVAAAQPATDALDQGFSAPGREGWETSQEILREYGNGGESAPLVPVVTLPEGTTASSPGVQEELEAVEETVKRALPPARVAGFGSTGDPAFVSDDGHTAFMYAFVPSVANSLASNAAAEGALRGALANATVAGAPVLLTGYDALREASNESREGPGVLLETVIGGVAALAVLVFVFGSALALVPLVTATASVLVSFLLLWGMTAVTDASPIVQYLIALIGLGVSIDYALIVVVRWREERERGREGDEAVAAAMRTAGRAVVFSGSTVAIALLALVALPLPFLRSIGLAGMFIPLVATLVAVTLLPAILATIGPRLDRRRIRRRDRSEAFWRRWSEGVVRRRSVAAGAALVLLAALLLAGTKIQLGNADPATIADAGPSKAGLDALEQSGIGAGAIAPVETLAPEADASAVAEAQADLKTVHGAVAPTGGDWRRGDQALVVGIPRAGDHSEAGRRGIDALRRAAHSASSEARVGGTGPLNADFVDAVYGSFPLMFALIAVLTFLLLARAFRSLLLPIKAIVLNVLSVGAALGVVTIVWQTGHGSDEIWGIAATGSIAAWIPLILFAFLYGLSMDYEVFILSRIREEYDETGDTDQAVVVGLRRTGRLVTSAALILFLTFVALASGPVTDVKVVATGLAAGILIDATLIRAVLVPAIVSMLGRWSWWLPSGAARMLRVRRSSEPVPESGGS